ncbi:MAG: methyl-accepting chemotaxis protein [Elioraea sp.]|nr:methyl-accepting chemotaxis protein [Elioraea sp.]
MTLFSDRPIAAKLSLALGVVALVACGVLAGAAVGLRAYDRAVRDLQNASERAQLAERLNGLVYAVVMDSRGIYMSADTQRARPFADGMRRSLAQMEQDVARWQALLPAERRDTVAPVVASAQDFIRLRTELARVGVEDSIEAANRLGNNEENRRNRQAFNAALDAAARATAAEVDAATRAVEGLAGRLTWWLAGGTAAGLLLASLLAWLTVARGVVSPLRGVTAALDALSAGRTDVAVPGAQRRDEVGQVARAAERFRAAIEERAALEEARRVEAEAKEKRALALAEEVGRFNAEAAKLIGEVGQSLFGLDTAVGALRRFSAAVADGSGAAGMAADQASGNVATVASAAEELSASIAEITRQVAESAQVAAAAVAKARETDATVQGLAEGAKRIGDVVRLIGDIAGQTNLLALNATIEAARAGEAGKGFAVVASEVKNLASQTAKATEEIAGQIAAIQGETERAVQAIRAIGGVIDEVNRIASAIAAAVEEQGAATREIARNVQEAARGTREVSTRVSELARVGGEAAGRTEEVATASAAVAASAQSLKREIERFLAEVRAA